MVGDRVFVYRELHELFVDKNRDRCGEVIDKLDNLKRVLEAISVNDISDLTWSEIKLSEETLLELDGLDAVVGVVGDML